MRKSAVGFPGGFLHVRLRHHRALACTSISSITGGDVHARASAVICRSASGSRGHRWSPKPCDQVSVPTADRREGHSGSCRPQPTTTAKYAGGAQRACSTPSARGHFIRHLHDQWANGTRTGRYRRQCRSLSTFQPQGGSAISANTLDLRRGTCQHGQRHRSGQRRWSLRPNRDRRHIGARRSRRWCFRTRRSRDMLVGMSFLEPAVLFPCRGRRPASGQVIFARMTGPRLPARRSPIV